MSSDQLKMVHRQAGKLSGTSPVLAIRFGTAEIILLMFQEKVCGKTSPPSSVMDFNTALARHATLFP